MTFFTAEPAQQLLHWQQEGPLHLAVTCDQQHRYLWINQQCQSQLQFSDPAQPCYPHLQAMLAQLPAQLHQVLQFGLGGGEFNRAFCHSWPQAALLTVESSAAVIALYQQYFQRPGSQEQFCCQDAKHFLQQHPQGDYNLIFVDLYPTPADLADWLVLLLPLLTVGGQLWLNLTDPNLLPAVAAQSAQLQPQWPHQFSSQQFVGYQNQLCLMQASR
jgi:trans-aconitate methyltransferase